MRSLIDDCMGLFFFMGLWKAAMKLNLRGPAPSREPAGPLKLPHLGPL